MKVPFAHLLVWQTANGTPPHDNPLLPLSNVMPFRESKTSSCNCKRCASVRQALQIDLSQIWLTPDTRLTPSASGTQVSKAVCIALMLRPRVPVAGNREQQEGAGLPTCRTSPKYYHSLSPLSQQLRDKTDIWQISSSFLGLYQWLWFRWCSKTLKAFAFGPAPSSDTLLIRSWKYCSKYCSMFRPHHSTKGWNLNIYKGSIEFCGEEKCCNQKAKQIKNLKWKM